MLLIKLFGMVLFDLAMYFYSTAISYTLFFPGYHSSVSELHSQLYYCCFVCNKHVLSIPLFNFLLFFYHACNNVTFRYLDRFYRGYLFFYCSADSFIFLVVWKYLSFWSLGRFSDICRSKIIHSVQI